jgi:hypothetical protein
MKLNATQLRKIIAEEVRNVRGRRLAESPGTMNAAGVLQARVNYGDVIGNAWKGNYDETDPSMSASGQESWSGQVDAAVDELQDRLEALEAEIEDKLYNGGYA